MTLLGLKREARSALGELAFRIGRDSVTYDGSTIPTRRLRFGGENFARDEDFVRSSEREAERLVHEFGLSPETRLLDVGCGPGRLPIGILRRVGEIAAYEGVDVDPAAVRWCRRHIEGEHATFRFRLLDVANSRYNPGGGADAAASRLPFEDASFDIVYLYSVFSHMLENDVRTYVREFRRVLAPGGKVFLTAFVEDDVPPVMENPPDYLRPWSGPLHCVRYERAFFEGLAADAGLHVERFVHGEETDGQSAVYLG
jgi:SAM-dependent methyltransferase